MAGRSMRASVQPLWRKRAPSSISSALEIAVGEVAHHFDGGAAIDAAAIEMSHFAGATIRIVAGGALRVLEALLFTLDDHAADPGDLGILSEIADGGGNKIRVELHTAVHQADVVSAAVLIAELSAGSARAVLNAVHAYDLDWIIFGDRDGTVGRGAVREHDFAVDSIESGKRAFNRGGDIALFIQSLDDDADGRARSCGHGWTCDAWFAAAGAASTGEIWLKPSAAATPGSNSSLVSLPTRPKPPLPR